LNLAAHMPAEKPCSSAGPNLLPTTHLKGYHASIIHHASVSHPTRPDFPSSGRNR
ncbi:uncharacterized protein BKA55DRAFT_526943, partial [Fusarium redolens]